MRPKSVDDYIASCPKDMQPRLEQLRAIIKAAAPKAEEKISYSMPYYGYKGRLIYFQLWKNHTGIYLPTPTVAQHKKELAGYVTTTATVQFPNDKKLPVGLIKKLVKARVKTNEQLERKKYSIIK